MPLSDFVEKARSLNDITERVVVYCHHGMRSMQATQFLRARGHQYVFSMAGGIDAWSAEIDPAVPRY